MPHNEFPHVDSSGGSSGGGGSGEVNWNIIADAFNIPVYLLVKQGVPTELGRRMAAAMGRPIADEPVSTGNAIEDMFNETETNWAKDPVSGDYIIIGADGVPHKLNMDKLAEASDGSGAAYGQLALAREKFEYDKQQDAQKTAEDRRQFDQTYARDIRRDAEQLGFDYDDLNQREKSGLRTLAYNYYNSTNDANASRMQALASLIQSRTSGANELASTSGRIAAQAAEFAANPRDAYADILYQNAVGGPVPYGQTSGPNAAAFAEYGTALDAKFQQMFGGVAGDLSRVRDYLDQPIPSEYTTPIRAPQFDTTPEQYGPPQQLGAPQGQFYGFNSPEEAQAMMQYFQKQGQLPGNAGGGSAMAGKMDAKQPMNGMTRADPGKQMMETHHITKTHPDGKHETHIINKSKPWEPKDSAPPQLMDMRREMGGMRANAAGGQQMLQEPVVGIGVESGRPLFTAAENGDELARFSPNGVEFVPQPGVPQQLDPRRQQQMVSSVMGNAGGGGGYRGPALPRPAAGVDRGGPAPIGGVPGGPGFDPEYGIRSRTPRTPPVSEPRALPFFPWDRPAYDPDLLREGDINPGRPSRPVRVTAPDWDAMFLSRRGDPRYNEMYDYDRDGAITALDMAAWANRPKRAPVSPVPRPIGPGFNPYILPVFPPDQPTDPIDLRQPGVQPPRRPSGRRIGPVGLGTKRPGWRRDPGSPIGRPVRGFAGGGTLTREAAEAFARYDRARASEGTSGREGGYNAYDRQRAGGGSGGGAGAGGANDYYGFGSNEAAMEYARAYNMIPQGDLGPNSYNGTYTPQDPNGPGGDPRYGASQGTYNQNAGSAPMGNGSYIIDGDGTISAVANPDSTFQGKVARVVNGRTEIHTMTPQERAQLAGQMRDQDVNYRLGNMATADPERYRRLQENTYDYGVDWKNHPLQRALKEQLVHGSTSDFLSYSGDARSPNGVEDTGRYVSSWDSSGNPIYAYPDPNRPGAFQTDRSLFASGQAPYDRSQLPPIWEGVAVGNRRGSQATNAPGWSTVPPANRFGGTGAPAQLSTRRSAGTSTSGGVGGGGSAGTGATPAKLTAEVSKRLAAIDPQLVLQPGQTLPDPRLLTSPALLRQLEADQDLYDLMVSAYSHQNISEAKLKAILKQMGFTAPRNFNPSVRVA